MLRKYYDGKEQKIDNFILVYNCTSGVKHRMVLLLNRDLLGFSSCQCGELSENLEEITVPA